MYASHDLLSIVLQWGGSGLSWLGIKIPHAERCGQKGDIMILYVNTGWEGKKKTMKDSTSMALFSLVIHLCSFFIRTIRFVTST